MRAVDFEKRDLRFQNVVMPAGEDGEQLGQDILLGDFRSNVFHSELCQIMETQLV